MLDKGPLFSIVLSIITKLWSLILDEHLSGVPYSGDLAVNRLCEQRRANNFFFKCGTADYIDKDCPSVTHSSRD